MVPIIIKIEKAYQLVVKSIVVVAATKVIIVAAAATVPDKLIRKGICYCCLIVEAVTATEPVLVVLIDYQTVGAS